MTVLTLAPTVAGLRPALAAIEKRTRELCSGLSDAQLRWRPPDGGWSVGQVLEHLVRINEPYIPRLTAALERGRQRASARGARPWKPTWLGGFIVRSQLSSRKVKTRRRFDPEPDAGPGAAPRFLATIHALDERVQASDGADLNVRFPSPVAAIFRPSIGDALVLLVVHAERHLHQIERILADPAFPREAA